MGGRVGGLAGTGGRPCRPTDAALPAASAPPAARAPPPCATFGTRRRVLPLHMHTPAAHMIPPRTESREQILWMDASSTWVSMALVVPSSTTACRLTRASGFSDTSFTCGGGGVCEGLWGRGCISEGLWCGHMGPRRAGRQEAPGRRRGTAAAAAAAAGPRPQHPCPIVSPQVSHPPAAPCAPAA